MAEPNGYELDVDGKTKRVKVIYIKHPKTLLLAPKSQMTYNSLCLKQKWTSAEGGKML